jgi:hypothetical protein
MLDNLLQAVYTVWMNRKSLKERTKILHSLTGGNTIQDSSRTAGVSKNTVAKLLVEVGHATTLYQNKHLINLPCEHIQVNNIWSFAYAKQKITSKDKYSKTGDVWTWTAICADTKLIPYWRIGTGSSETGNSFIHELDKRIARRVRLALPCVEATKGSSAGDVDFSILVKNHRKSENREKPAVVKKMEVRRFVRPKNAFSKKLENHIHAVSFHLMFYNFSRVHKTLQTTPAVRAGVTDHIWSLEEIAALVD